MTLTVVGSLSIALLVLLVAAAWTWRCYRRELTAVQGPGRWGLPLLRIAALTVIALIIAQPAAILVQQHRDRAIIEVLVDSGASMGASDPTLAATALLDEAEAAGLGSLAERDLRPRQALESLHKLGQALEQQPTTDRALRRAYQAWARELSDHADALSGHEALAADLQALAEILATSEQPLSQGAWEEHATRLQRMLRRVQRDSDAAAINALGDEHEFAKELEEFALLPRIERVARIWQERVQPALQGSNVELRVRRADASRASLDLNTEQRGDLGLLSNYAQPLRAIAETPGDEHITGIVVIGDGRHDGGGEERSIARALGLRQIPVHGLWIGSPDVPRDAAIAEIAGSREVHRGEQVVLDVRYRVSGYGESPWSLIMSRDGEVIDQRVVVGTGEWAVERFEWPVEEVGTKRITAQLQPMADVQEVIAESDRAGGLLWEAWTGVRDVSTDDLHRVAAFEHQPMHEEIVNQAESPHNWADHYVSRLSGWIIPPETGEYVFFVRADDGAQLWLSDGPDRDGRRLIASCPSHTGIDAWERHDEQRSESISLRAGQPYYIEALHWERTGGDHVGIGWQLPDGSVQRPIAGKHLVARGDQLSDLFTGADGPSDQAYPPQASRDNDQAHTMVVVHDDPLRVLLIDHAPRWDARYLVSLLERDQHVDIDRRYRHIRLSLGELEMLPPSQEALDAYDLVILGDLRQDELEPEEQERLARFVQSRGGMLIVLAGPRGMPHGLSLGPLADVLPVQAQTTVERTRRGGHRLRLAVDTDEVSWMQILEDAELNERLWPLLPALTWVADGVSAKSGAQVLLETDDQNALPVVVSARTGAGRVMYMGSDETWRWRDRLGGRVHETFWMQALRWGLGGRLRGHDPRLQMALAPTMVRPGETVELRARAMRDDGSIADGPPQAVIRDQDGEEYRLIDLQPVANAEGMWRVALSDLPRGTWQVQLRSPDPELEDLREERQVLVGVDAHRATAELRADPDVFARMASASEGMSAHIADADAVLAAIREKAQPRQREQRRTWRLWDHYHVILLVTLLLFAEWLWRKRSGLP